MLFFRRFRTAAAGFLFSWLIVTNAWAAAPMNDLSGYAYLDYFWNAQRADATREDVNGARFRRIRLTLDHAPTEAIQSRFRLESAPNAVYESTVDHAEQVGVFVREAYVGWTVPGAWTSSVHPQLVAGIQLTPGVYQYEEAVWGYRSLEAVSVDLYGYIPTADLGVSVKGRFGSSDFGYWLMVGNDSNQAESDTKKRYYGLLRHQSETVTAELFGGLRTTPDERDETTAKAFLAYTGEASTLGATLFGNWKRNTPALDDMREAVGFSGFIRVPVSDKVELIGRADLFDPNTDVDDDGSTMLLAALSYSIHDDLNVMPNVVIQIPRNLAVNEDVVPRLTIHYEF